MIRDFKYIVTEEDYKNNLAITAIMKQNFNFSSRLRTKIKKNNGLYLNGNQVRSWIVPKPGDVITINIPEERSDFPPEKIPVEVVFEDKDLLLLNKQPGIVVHPTKGHPSHTIANAITNYMDETGQGFKIRFINRLDMDTSGILALAKNSHSQDCFTKQMQADMVKKEYLAIVIGIMEEDEGTIDLPITRDGVEGIRRIVSEDGVRCITHFKVLKRYEKGYSLVKLQLETGRTHQIRVHLSHIGFPIVGDQLYGGQCPLLIDRQALHAYHLSFNHPVTDEKLDLYANLPEDMQEVLIKIGGERFNG